MRSALAIVVVFLLTTLPAYADFDDGMSAYDQDDYETALEHWQPLAEAGDPEAQTWLGIMYARGKGVPLDAAAAEVWLHRAADQVHASGQRVLGYLYHEGEVFPLDVVRGIELLHLAADQGDPKAQYNLGMIYATGDGVEKDLVQGHMWLNLSTAQSNARISGFARLALTHADYQMTLSQIARAEQLARKWMAEHPEFLRP